MNGPHDMGGAMGFGAINPEVREPVFHAEWEGRTYALLLAMGSTGAWPNNRPWRESLPALKYWSASYYEIWFEALVKQLIVGGMPVKPKLLLAARRVQACRYCRY